MSILDHELISERYFFPRTYAPPNPTWVDVDGARLACFATEPRHPLTVVHFHGNGEVVADYVPEFVETLGALGADVFLVEYRGYGASTGTPQLGGMLDDIPAIFDAVGRPADELVVFGRSVGSIYAIEFAFRYPDVAGLILESGIADPRERILLRCSPDELGVTADELEAAFAERLDNLEKLRTRRKPTLVMHSRNDSLVDVSHAARLASAPAEKVDLVVFERGDHNTIFMENRRHYLAETERLLHRCRGEFPDETLEGIQIPHKTVEFETPVGPGRAGPGETTPINVPEALRERSRTGPGETEELDQPELDQPELDEDS